MASVDISENLNAPRAGVFAKISEFFVNVFTAQRRVSEFEALSCMSDKELEKRGLKREDIARYILRDIYYI